MAHLSPFELFIAALFWMLLGTPVLYLGYRLVRALERRQTSKAEIQALNERVLRLEEAVESAREDMGRLHDRQEFTDRLLDGTVETGVPRA